MIIMLVNNNYKTKAFSQNNKNIKVVEYWKNIKQPDNFIIIFLKFYYSINTILYSLINILYKYIYFVYCVLL